MPRDCVEIKMLRSYNALGIKELDQKVSINRYRIWCTIYGVKTCACSYEIGMTMTTSTMYHQNAQFSGVHIKNTRGNITMDS